MPWKGLSAGVLLTTLLAILPLARADVVDQITSLNFGAEDNEIADQAAWESIKKNPQDKNRIDAIFRLASLDNHPDAKNFAGCLLFNGKLIAQNKDQAMEYFSLAASDRPLATFNLGVTRLSINKKDERVWELVADAFDRIHLKQAGELLLYYQAATKKIDANLLDAMYSVKSPLAYYLKAYGLYLKGSYLESLNISLAATDFGDLNAMLLSSKNHFALANKDATNQRPALKWQYIYELYTQKNKIDPSAHDNGEDVEREAWHEAIQYVSTKKLTVPNYFQTVCEPKTFAWQ